MPQLSVQRLFEEKQERLSLAWAACPEGGNREVNSAALLRPGIGLIGHLNLIHPHRFQVLGLIEINHLKSLAADELGHAIDKLFSNELAAIFVANGLEVPHFLMEKAVATGTPLFVSPEPSPRLINLLRQYLQRVLAESTTLHGVFLDVLGLGVLITGDSSIGKSELALELVSRGHGLVADDIVEMHQIAPDTLQGRCPPLLKDFLEVRGLGVLNIRSIFGETAVRPKMNLKLIVRLQEPTEADINLDRLKPNAGTQTILGVPVPAVVLSVLAGRNLAVLVEAAVRNHILHLRGIDSTREFIARHEQYMAAAPDDAEISGT